VSPLLDKILRAGEGRHIRQLEKIAKDILALEPEISALDDVQLRAQTIKLKDQLASGKTLEDLLPQFAKPPSALLANATTTFKSWAEPHFTKATLQKCALVKVRL
jgi:SecA DEAD-like domain